MLKSKLWWIQLPVVAFFTFAFLVTEAGVQGRLDHPFLREQVYQRFRNFSNAFTDLKFQFRGPLPPKNKVVIVEIDSPSLDPTQGGIGRWPWHRDAIAKVIDRAFEYGAKVVGLDIVFSEPDPRVPEGLIELLKAREMDAYALGFETDLELAKVIEKHRDRLVLGWVAEGKCQPRYDGPQECPADDPTAYGVPEGFEKFQIAQTQLGPSFSPGKTPVFTVFNFLDNLPFYDESARHSGYFNTELDLDGYVRRTPLIMVSQGKGYPSLALEMARVGLGEEVSLELGEDSRVSALRFINSKRDLPVNSMGIAEINFRGGGQSFPYVPVMDLLSDSEVLKDELNRKLAGAKKVDLLKDAYVLIGLSAVGVFDMRAFPFGSNIAGVEGHANILDNLLSDDFLIRGNGKNGDVWMLLLMVVGAIAFGYAIQRLESVPALILFVLVFSGVGLADVKIFFQNQINWDTSFLYVELFTIFVLTVSAKYVMEEKNKKFVKGAFSKYVSPDVVDSIIKDPTKLTVGGEKRELTIMFSDIRSFTTFSERMDAKALSSFLNDYLGIMTEIVISNQGTLDKYIGDAIMAFWGAPLDQPKHAENACRAAFQMMQALAQNKERFKSQYGVDVSIGIGLNSGMVSVGNMGSNKNFAYTVIGDHVNLASRLEGLTKYYGASILTTRFTFDSITAATGAFPAHRVLDRVKVKGKKNAVELIQVLDRQMPEEGLRIFEQARELYGQCKWDEAIDRFRAAATMLCSGPGESDGPCDLYIERCEELKKAPPAEGWDGSWEMHSK